MTNSSLPSTCTHCGDGVRRVGLQLVANSDDSTGCPEAPMEACSCIGKGCGSCEGCGEKYGRHAVSAA